MMIYFQEKYEMHAWSDCRKYLKINNKNVVEQNLVTIIVLHAGDT